VSAPPWKIKVVEPIALLPESERRLRATTDLTLQPTLNSILERGFARLSVEEEGAR
jgi:hypothetical protein